MTFVTRPHWNIYDVGTNNINAQKYWDWDYPPKVTRYLSPIINVTTYLSPILKVITYLSPHRKGHDLPYPCISQLLVASSQLNGKPNLMSLANCYHTRMVEAD